MNSPVALLRLVQVVDLDTLIDGCLAGIVLQPIYWPLSPPPDAASSRAESGSWFSMYDVAIVTR